VEGKRMSTGNVSLVKGIDQAFGTGDVPAVIAGMSPAIEWNEAENFPYADGDPYIGGEAMLGGVFGRIGSDWDGFHVGPERFLDAGDMVIMAARYAGPCRATGAA
jgi:ketosteroid isomerase-like protein